MVTSTPTYNLGSSLSMLEISLRHRTPCPTLNFLRF
ncbi:hypothetical protein BVRB_7g170660 [Beta vulgaris subsp. vulgaris]|nr:hypothetical protein BVRB_7g170660 [Beta vulgaris subsp. vulgaris]